jgi:hypothetical protein
MLHIQTIFIFIVTRNTTIESKIKISNLFLNFISELQNRKILEELQIKKQLLLKQGVAQTLSTSISVTTTITSTALVR